MQIVQEKKENRTPTAGSLIAAERKIWIPWLFAVLSGILQVLIFPSPNWNSLCWIATAPLLVALIKVGASVRNGWRAVGLGFALGWVSGITFYAGSCYWVDHVMTFYGGLSTPLAAGVLVLFSLYVGLVHGLFGALLSLSASRGWGMRALLLAPFFWVATELFRSRVIAFPWDLLGTVLVDNIPLSRIASITGVYGLSFEVMLMNGALVAILLGHRERRTLMLALWILILGTMETGRYIEPPAAVPTGTARLVQQNISLDQRWTPESYEQMLSELANISVMHPGEGMPGDPLPDLILWPESPAPFYGNDPRYVSTLGNVARDAHAYVLAGSLGVAHGSSTQQVFNSAELVAPSGEFIARYDKIHLVPFGEYVPFKDMFSFAKKLTKEVGDFVPGTERIVLPVHSYRLGTFICYESIFPNEVRVFAKEGAGLLVNISNDGWFGDTGAPWQHLRMARMRAIENHRWVLRSTNTGLSVSIDPFGRVVQQLRRNVRAAVDVPYGVVSSTTFYTRHGDWFAWTCAIISLGALFLRPPLRTGTHS